MSIPCWFALKRRLCIPAFTMAFAAGPVTAGADVGLEMPLEIRIWRKH